MRSAVAFLTVLPVGGSMGAPRRATLLAFPVVGIAMGCAWAGLAWATDAAWSPLVAAALVVALDLLLTGGLHADAAADVADGVASRREPAEALRIMREPQVGAIGAAAAAVVLLLRFAFLAALVTAELWPLVVLAPVAGRAAMVLVLARPDSGGGPSLARGFSEAAGPAIAAGAVAIAAAACLAGGWLAEARTGAGLALAALAGALVAALAFERAFRRRFGVRNGDAVGCAGVLAEIVALAVLALTPEVVA